MTEFFRESMVQLYIIAILFIGGWLLKHSKIFPENAAATLNQFVIYVSLPALILAKLPHLEITSATWKPVTIAWFALFIGAIFVLSISALFKWSREVTGALLVVVPLGNTSFVGVPLIQALVGDKGIPIAILYDQLGSFLGLIIYGTWVIAFYSGGAKPTISQILKKILTFPPFWAMVFAFLFSTLLKTPTLNKAFTLVGNTLVPVVIIALGMQFNIKLPKHNLPPLALALGIKLVLIPLSVLSLVSMNDWQGLPIQVSILESAMAPMISAGALVMAAGMAPQLVAAVISWGMLISFITVPVWYGLLGIVFSV